MHNHNQHLRHRYQVHNSTALFFTPMQPHPAVRHPATSIPAVVSLGVVVLLLISCVVLLVLALAVTATKRNKVRAEKGHTDPTHYYKQTGGGEEKSKLNLETMEKRQYETLH